MEFVSIIAMALMLIGSFGIILLKKPLDKVIMFSILDAGFVLTVVLFKYLDVAMFAALAFVIWQYLYVETQVFVSRMNTVYGAFAAIPLFLIWINVSWTIILYGAEISHAYQYENSYTSSDNYQELEMEVIKKINRDERCEN